MTYLLIVVCTYLFIKYVEPIFDELFELFISIQSEKITEHNLSIQEMSCLLLRAYPELKDGNIVDQVNAIGFQCQSDDEIEYYDEEDEE